MTRIDFYILPDNDSEARLRFACRLIDKAQRLGHKVFVATDGQSQAQSLSELLWTQQPESFIPHEIQVDRRGPEQTAPVCIGYGEECGDHHEVLINLASAVPAYFSRFQRLSEVVVQEPAILEDTRANFKFYRDRGYPIQSHDMRSR